MPTGVSGDGGATVTASAGFGSRNTFLATMPAQAISPLIEEAEPLETLLQNFQAMYSSGWQSMMAAKLGLKTFTSSDVKLVDELDDILQLAETDMTIFFRRLAHLDVANANDDPLGDLLDAYYVPAQLNEEVRVRINDWLTSYLTRLKVDGMEQPARRAVLPRVRGEPPR